MTRRTFKFKLWKNALVGALVVTAGLASVVLARGDVGIMTKEELRKKLGKPKVVVLDVRTGSDWRASEIKIKGAMRVEARQITSVAPYYAKDTTLVLYCA